MYLYIYITIVFSNTKYRLVSGTGPSWYALVQFYWLFTADIYSECPPSVPHWLLIF